MSKQPKLIHKLLVEFKLKPEKPLTSEDFQVKLILKNIGDSVFPGGQLTRFSVSFSANTQNVNTTDLPRIPTINVNESIELEPHTFFAIEDGTVWIQATLKAADDTEAHLFQNPDYDMGSTWGTVCQIRKREYVDIINLLQKIVELLEKRGKENE